MTEEEKKVIVEFFFNGDVEDAIYEMLYDYDNPNKEQAVNFFHKAKKVYEIFGLKNSFALIETKKFGKTFYSMYDKESDEHKNFKIIEE